MAHDPSVFHPAQERRVGENGPATILAWHPSEVVEGGCSEEARAVEDRGFAGKGWFDPWFGRERGCRDERGLDEARPAIEQGREGPNGHCDARKWFLSALEQRQGIREAEDERVAM